MSKKKKKTIETDLEVKTETQSVTWRMPRWVAAEHAGDWSGLREVLDTWATKGKKLEIPDGPEETTSVCLRVSTETLAALEAEAARLSKTSKRKWTAGKVARSIYESQFEAS